jgi:hypothetical protein
MAELHGLGCLNHGIQIVSCRLYKILVDETEIKMNKKILLSAIAVCFLLTGCAKEVMPQQTQQSSSAPTTTSSATTSETSSSSVSTISNSSSSLEQLKSIFEKYTIDQITFFQSFTIGNNQTAAFAMAGGDVWYVTSSGVQKLKSGIGSASDDPSDKPVLWTVDGTKIFKCEDVAGGSSTMSYAWYVKDGKPVALSYMGMHLSYLGNGQFTTIGDTFDAIFTDGMECGHTYKIYYLYWTTDGLKEYCGLKITQQQLLKVNGAQAIINTIVKSGHTVDEIYYRDNNIINVNYHSGDKQNGNLDNVTLILKNNTVTPALINTGSSSSKTECLNEKDLSDFSYGGIYQAELFPKIATSTDKFPIN